MVLKQYNHEFVESMNVQSMLSHLQQEDLLTANEYEKLTKAMQFTTSREQNQYLLGILPSKGKGVCERFLKCLLMANDHTGHAHLVEILTTKVV